MQYSECSDKCRWQAFQADWMQQDSPQAQPKGPFQKYLKFADKILRAMRIQGPRKALRLVLSRIDKLDIVQFGIRRLLLPFRVSTVHMPVNLDELEQREPMAFSVLRNGMPWIKSFLAHHRKIGIHAFVMLDNGSDDGTLEYLKSQTDVILIQSSAPYRLYENTFKRYICNKFGKNRWCLFIDVDELFYYPGIIDRPIDELTSFLEDQEFDAAIMQMLDLFADLPIADIPDTTDLDLIEQFQFYETATILRSPLENTFGNVVPAGLEQFHGGVRRRVFGTDNNLTKVSLFLNHGRLKPFHFWHYVKNARLADCTFALLHFPFSRSYREKVMEAASAGRYGWVTDDEYDAYAAVMLDQPSLNLMSEHSRRLSDPMQLVDEGFIMVSPQFRRWLESDPRSPVPAQAAV